MKVGFPKAEPGGGIQMHHAEMLFRKNLWGGGEAGYREGAARQGCGFRESLDVRKHFCP